MYVHYMFVFYRWIVIVDQLSIGVEFIHNSTLLLSDILLIFVYKQIIQDVSILSGI